MVRVTGFELQTVYIYVLNPVKYIDSHNKIYKKMQLLSNVIKGDKSSKGYFKGSNEGQTELYGTSI